MNHLLNCLIVLMPILVAVSTGTDAYCFTVITASLGACIGYVTLFQLDIYQFCVMLLGLHCVCGNTVCVLGFVCLFPLWIHNSLTFLYESMKCVSQGLIDHIRESERVYNNVFGAIILPSYNNKVRLDEQVNHQFKACIMKKDPPELLTFSVFSRNVIAKTAQEMLLLINPVYLIILGFMFMCVYYRSMILFALITFVFTVLVLVVFRFSLQQDVKLFIALSAISGIVTFTHVFFGIYTFFFNEQYLVFYFGCLMVVVVLNIVYCFGTWIVGTIPRHSFTWTFFILVVSCEILSVGNYAYSVEVSKTQFLNASTKLILSDYEIQFVDGNSTDVERLNSLKGKNNIVYTNNPKALIKAAKQNHDKKNMQIQVGDMTMSPLLFDIFRNESEWNVSLFRKDLVKNGTLISTLNWDVSYFSQELKSDFHDLYVLLSSIAWESVDVDTCVDNFVDYLLPLIYTFSEESGRYTFTEAREAAILDMIVSKDVKNDNIKKLLKRLLTYVKNVFARKA